MTPLAQILQFVFIAIWCGAMLTWIFGVANFLPVWWAMLRRRDPDRTKVKRSLLAGAIFVSLVLAGFAVGGIAQLAGGWR